MGGHVYLAPLLSERKALKVNRLGIKVFAPADTSRCFFRDSLARASFNFACKKFERAPSGND
jgi:hypothetical protein